jgi:hypothetical protein
VPVLHARTEAQFSFTSLNRKGSHARHFVTFTPFTLVKMLPRQGGGIDDITERVSYPIR